MQDTLSFIIHPITFLEDFLCLFLSLWFALFVQHSKTLTARLAAREMQLSDISQAAAGMTCTNRADKEGGADRQGGIKWFDGKEPQSK